MSEHDEQIQIFILGNPVPKQSYRHSTKGKNYTDERVKTWQNTVAQEANIAYRGDPLTCDVAVWIDFVVADRRRKDLDNLSKGVLDGLNGIVWKDDKQVVELHLTKRYERKNGSASVRVTEIGETE